jgi:hypothetical protein
MVIFQLGEETERVSFLFSGIEEDNLVAESLVKLLIFVEKRAGPQIRVHIPDTVEEHIGTAILVNLAHVLHDAAMDVLHETFAVGLDDKGLLDSISLLTLNAGIIHQSRGVLITERTVLEIGAEFLIDVQGEDIDIVDRAQNLLLDVSYLLPHLIFLLRGIEVNEEVIKQITVGGILELLTAKLCVKLLYGHIFHRARLLMVSISYAGTKHA